MVTTPGGPRARSRVHRVNPGELVEVQSSGAPRVRPRARARTSVAKPAIAANLVATPGGYRSRSLVHRVDPGHAVDLAADGLRIRSLASNAEVSRIARPKANVVAPKLGDEWIADAYWNNDSGSPITSFRTTWEVPDEPSTDSGQLIYLFNGMTRYYGNNAVILQPVLQWGTGPDGGGAFWTIASWYVHLQGDTFYTPFVAVNPGDAVTGVMTAVDQGGGLFTYRSEFEGVTSSVLTVQNAEELVWCSQTLEAYRLERCSDYPASAATAFRSIELVTAAGVPNVNWQEEDRVTDCGQHVKVVKNVASDGEVEIFYR
jgi:hypothetical protein